MLSGQEFTLEIKPVAQIKREDHMNQHNYETISHCKARFQMADRRYNIALDNYQKASEHMEQIQHGYKPWAPKWEEATDKLRSAGRVLSWSRESYLRAKAALDLTLRESGHFATISG